MKIPQRFKSIQPEIIEAQNYFEEYKLDQAIQSLNMLSQEQLEGLPIEIQLQFHKLKGRIFVTMENPVKALPPAEKAYEIASKYQEFRDSIEKLDAFLLFAEALMKTSKLEECAEILEEIEIILTKLPDKPEKIKKERRAEKLRIQGGLYWNTGRDCEAGKLREELHEIYSELGDWHNLAGNYDRIGWTCYLAGDINEALNNLAKSKEILEKIDDSPFFKPVEVYNLLLYAEISSHRGDLIEALNYQEKALSLAREYRLSDQVIWILLNIGITYLKLADWEKDISYFQIMKELKNPEVKQGILFMLEFVKNMAKPNNRSIKVEQNL